MLFLLPVGCTAGAEEGNATPTSTNHAATQTVVGGLGARAATPEADARPAPPEGQATQDEQAGGFLSFLTFRTNPLWLNAALFAVAAAIVWFAGTRLERYADAFAERTGLGEEFVGLLLLAVATSLPEIATIVTATLSGNVELAVHNLLGGIPANMAILAIADLRLAGGALTRFSPRFVLLINGVGVVVMLAIALLAMVIGAHLTLTIGEPFGSMTFSIGAVLLLVAYVLVMFTTYRARGHSRWQPAPATLDPGGGEVQRQEIERQQQQVPIIEQKGEQQEQQQRADHHEEHKQHGQSQNQASHREQEDRQVQGDATQEEEQRRTITKLIVYFVLASLLVLAAGWALARSADALATQSGLGAGFVGAIFLSLATVLPELSTTLTAVSEENYGLAISNVFGSSAFLVVLLVLVSALYTAGPIFQVVPVSAQFATVMGILMVCVYLWGLMEREDHTFLRMGWDSVTILLLYMLGALGIYYLS